MSNVDRDHDHALSYRRQMRARSRQIICKALRKHRGPRAAAVALDVNRTDFYRLMRARGISWDGESVVDRADTKHQREPAHKPSRVSGLLRVWATRPVSEQRHVRARDERGHRESA